MGVKNIFAGALNQAKKLCNVTKAHKPEIKIIVGCVGFTAAVVVGCYESMKMPTILEQHRATLHDIQEAVEGKTEVTDYTEEDAKHDTRVTYIRTGVSIAKLYWLVALLMVGSGYSIVSSHRDMKKINAGLSSMAAAAFAALERRKQLERQKFGEEAQQAITYELETTKTEQTVIDKKGKQKTVIKTETKSNGASSPYMFWWGPGNETWDANPYVRVAFLKGCQSWFNTQLRSGGTYKYVVLNDILRYLKIPEVDYGLVAGWTYIPNRTDGKNNYIDIGLFDPEHQVYGAKEFIEGTQDGVWLNFNVEGSIYDNFYNSLGK